MTDGKKHHPIIKINYVPRIFASTFMGGIVILKLGWAALSPEYIWLLVWGAAHPHLSLWLAMRSQHGKRQEILNMHLDAFLTGVLVSVMPDYYFLTAATIVLAANALYIGLLRLLITSMICYAVGLTLAMGYFWPFNGFFEVPWPVKIATTSFLLIYFCTFAVMSYFLTRRMIRLHKEIRELSMIDPLTGAYNRLFLDKYMTKEISRSRRLNYPVTVVFADLDHFKQINDKYGHQFGDHILQEFVKITNSCIREDVDWIARFGGEEFVVVLPNADASCGNRIAERIRSTLNKHQFKTAEKSLSVTSSFGVVGIDYKNKTATAENLIASADFGLYQAKAKGRNRVEIVELMAHEADRSEIP